MAGCCENGKAVGVHIIKAIKGGGVARSIAPPLIF